MEIFNYILLIIITYMGMFCGALLVFIAPEEQKPGKKYCLILQRIIIFLITIILLADSLNFSNISLALFLLILMMNKDVNNYLLYITLAPVLYLLRESPTIIFVSYFIFLNSLLIGLLLTNHKRLASLWRFLRFSYYPILGIVLFTINYFF